VQAVPSTFHVRVPGEGTLEVRKSEIAVLDLVHKVEEVTLVRLELEIVVQTSRVEATAGRRGPARL